MASKEIHATGWEGFYALRSRWSTFIMFAIGTLVLFQIGLTLAIGTKWINFDNNKLFLNLVIGENFAQIVGLAYIVVKCLFKDPPNIKPGQEQLSSA